jgi:hypothetical protein
VIFIFVTSAIVVNAQEIKLNDCIMVEPLDPTMALFIARVVYLFEDRTGAKRMHGHWFWYVFVINIV